MSFLVDTSHRSSEMEIMDDFTMEGVLIRDTLDKIEIINRFLGGNTRKTLNRKFFKELKSY